MKPLVLTAPAKINLYLAVTGRRPDGFHDLVSVVAPLAWGDDLSILPTDSGFSLECDDPQVPVDGSNLVLKAAAAFAGASGWPGGAHFSIAKRIPAGAGLGGASTDAVSALVGLNSLAGSPLDASGLARVASGVGSDCALFLNEGPSILRGRGERVEPMPQETHVRVRGLRLLLFKPGFAISTRWAYGRLAADAPNSYVPAAKAEDRLASWLARPYAAAASLLYNSMEPPAFRKFPALPLLLGALRSKFDLSVRMTGSGSACFALLERATDVDAVGAEIRRIWGPSAFVKETRTA